MNSFKYSPTEANKCLSFVIFTKGVSDLQLWINGYRRECVAHLDAPYNMNAVKVTLAGNVSS